MEWADPPQTLSQPVSHYASKAAISFCRLKWCVLIRVTGNLWRGRWQLSRTRQPPCKSAGSPARHRDQEWCPLPFRSHHSVTQSSPGQDKIIHVNRYKGRGRQSTHTSSTVYHLTISRSKINTNYIWCTCLSYLTTLITGSSHQPVLGLISFITANCS